MAMLRTALIVLGCIAGPAAAQTRIAGVAVERALRGFERAAAARAAIEVEQVAIAGDPRQAKLEELAEEVRQAEARARRGAADDDAGRLDAEQRAAIKRDDYRSMAAVLAESRNNRTLELNRRIVAQTREFLGQIQAIAAEIGRERGYDCVVDPSGRTNTGLPLILYSLHLPDLTDEVIARLNARHPPQIEQDDIPDHDGAPDTPAGDDPPADEQAAPEADPSPESETAADGPPASG